MVKPFLIQKSLLKKMSNMEAAALLRRAAAALDPREQHCVPTTSVTVSTKPNTSAQSVQSPQVAALRNIFAPYTHNAGNRSSSRRSTGRNTFIREPGPSYWSHKLFCLGKTLQDSVPASVEKQQLFESGLGERKITFRKDNDPLTFKNKLEEVFPKLAFGGGFELLRTSFGSRVMLEKIQMPASGFTTTYLCDSSNLNQALCYIAPIQRNLDMMPAVTTEECTVDEACLTCGEMVPLTQLRDHISSCNESGGETVPVKRTRLSADVPICGFACVIWFSYFSIALFWLTRA